MKILQFVTQTQSKFALVHRGNLIRWMCNTVYIGVHHILGKREIQYNVLWVTSC